MSMIAVVDNQVLQITYEPPRSKFERELSELKDYLIGLANLNGIAERTAMRQIPYMLYVEEYLRLKKKIVSHKSLYI